MTTGCVCGSPGCGGIASEPGGRCAGCQVDAMPPGAGRTVQQIIHAVLYGADVPRGVQPGGRGTQKEAGA
jgi:hypothetical protein